MLLNDKQKAFVDAYILGRSSTSEAGERASETSQARPDLISIWRDAKESTDSGISRLQKAMKTYKHPDLDNIADKGLNGITNGNQVAMMAALRDYEAAAVADRPEATKKLLSQIDAYRTFLSTSQEVALCERNPFGVEVAIRRPLSAALVRIAKIAST